MAAADKLTIRNPYSGEPIEKLETTGREELASVCDRAAGAFASRARAMTPFERYEILHAVAESLAGLREDFARLIASESGKPLKDSRVEVERSRQTLLFSAAEARGIRGESLPSDVTASRVGKLVLTSRVPLGVVAAITPFNFPLNLVAHKVGPAIAAGNAVVLKPSSKTPLTALRLQALFRDAGCPADLFQVVIGPGALGEALAGEETVRLISFTGSVTVGRRLASVAGMKRLALELGGNDPLIVMPDADIPQAARVAVEQGIGSNGQRCTAVKRVIAHRKIVEELTREILVLVARLRVGDPLDPETDVGPLITEKAAVEIEGRIREAQERGARLLAGGERKGAVLQPTVLADVTSAMSIVVEETFGPVLPILAVDDADQAIRIANSTIYGLNAGLFTRDLESAKRFYRELEVGTLVVNDGPGLRLEHVPFGGTKASGLGREGVRYAIEEMTEIKTLMF